MNSNRKAAPDYLANLSANESRVLTGALFEFTQEMIFAVWLIVKGCNPSAIAPESVKQI